MRCERCTNPPGCGARYQQLRKTRLIDSTSRDAEGRTRGALHGQNRAHAGPLARYGQLVTKGGSGGGPGRRPRTFGKVASRPRAAQARDADAAARAVWATTAKEDVVEKECIIDPRRSAEAELRKRRGTTGSKPWIESSIKVKTRYTRRDS